MAGSARIVFYVAAMSAISVVQAADLIEYTAIRVPVISFTGCRLGAVRVKLPPTDAVSAASDPSAQPARNSSPQIEGTCVRYSAAGAPSSIGQMLRLGFLKGEPFVDINLQ